MYFEKKYFAALLTPVTPQGSLISFMRIEPSIRHENVRSVQKRIPIHHKRPFIKKLYEQIFATDKK